LVILGKVRGIPQSQSEENNFKKSKNRKIEMIDGEIKMNREK